MLIPVTAFFIALVVSAAGARGDAAELQVEGDVVREPSDGVFVYSKESKTVSCTLKEGSSDDDDDVSDTTWYLVLAADKEELIEGQSSSELDVTGIVEEGVSKVRCRIGEGNLAEFSVGASNVTRHRQAFKVKKFDKSYEIDVQQDRQFRCVVVNRTAPLEEVMKEVDVKWYKWEEANDMSFQPQQPDKYEKKRPNCSVESMAGSGWVEIRGTEMEEGDIEPHIQVFKKTTMKLEDARFSDRRGYKCIAYNVSDPDACSESVFFIRVKDKYAALWPFLGIVAEVVVLCVVIFLCERRKSSKDPEEEEEQNGKAMMGVQAGGNSSSSVRQRRS